MNNNLTVAAHLFSANNTNTNVMPILNSSSLSTYSMPNQQRKQLEKSPKLEKIMLTSKCN